ncbi:hypothetical protein F511_45486 [Dorcoceras hygrometricum]|uniref:Uncharacterized protein n=1 Tax=Dorcoceras hygrometricum TaxID=472368 RepID=A0A2Z7A3K7_9LAMI|nr:hypothetical protein F511_45486 [Dorcoceras hygrometricum]
MGIFFHDVASSLALLCTTADSYALALLLVFLHLLIVMMSSLLLIASFRMYADVITAVSRFLSISNADVNVTAPDFTNPVPAGSTWPPLDFEHLT